MLIGCGDGCGVWNESVGEETASLLGSVDIDTVGGGAAPPVTAFPAAAAAAILAAVGTGTGAGIGRA